MAVGAKTNPSLESLECVETGFARIYRDDREVFKTRKAVLLRLGRDPIDLRTPDLRRTACLEEERVGRRLAPDVILGVVPVTADADGSPRFGGDGAARDWALHMLRLPDDERADRRLARGLLDDGDLCAVARRLVDCHERARGQGAEGAEEALDRLRAQVTMRVSAARGMDAAGPETGRPVSDGLEGLEAIEVWQLSFLEAEADRFRARAASAAIHEGHGELALEHVFLDGRGEVRILPGFEAGPGIRCLDVAADVALLATDLAAQRRVDLAERFVADYALLANDFDFYPLLDFHSSLRASLRAKIDWHCATHGGLDPKLADRYRARARRFAALARAVPRRSLLPPSVIAMGGQVASGKSTIARDIARRIGAPVVGSDATRDFMLGDRSNEALHEAGWEAAYERDFGERVYAEVIRRAGEVLTSGRPVVIDGCFRSREQRRRARSLAQQFGRPFLFVEASVPEALQSARLAERAERDAVEVAAWQAIADQLRAQWEPATELPESEHLILDTSRPLEQNALLIEARIPTWPSALTD